MAEFRIEAKIDASQLQALAQHGVKRLPYAAVGAINKTLLRGQGVVRGHVRQHFTLRKPDFVLREAAKIDFASVPKGRLFGEIYVGQKPRLLLSQFEEGGVKQAVKGKRVAVPKTGEAPRPAFGQPVAAPYRFSALKLRKTRPLEAQPSAGRKRVRRSKGGDSGVRYGERGTYQIPNVGVFQRTAGDEQSRIIYPFIQAPRLDDGLEFEANVRTTANQWFSEYMEQEVVSVLVRPGR